MGKDEADYNGVFAMLVCRTFMGKFYYTKKRDDSVGAKIEKGRYDSTVGDRIFRELVAYNSDQIYPEYLLFYHRRYIRDNFETFSEIVRKPLELPSTVVIE